MAHGLVADDKLTPTTAVRRTHRARAPMRGVPRQRRVPRGTCAIPQASTHEAAHRATPGRHHAPRADASRTPRGRTMHPARPQDAPRPCNRGFRRCRAVHASPGLAPGARVRRGADCAASPPPPLHSRRRARRATRHATPDTQAPRRVSTTRCPERDPPRLAAPATRHVSLHRRGVVARDTAPLGLARRRSAAPVGFDAWARRISTGRRTVTPSTSPSSPVSPRAHHRVHECIRQAASPAAGPPRRVAPPGARVSRAPRTGPGRARTGSHPRPLHRSRAVRARSARRVEVGGHTGRSGVHTRTSTLNPALAEGRAEREVVRPSLVADMHGSPCLRR